MYCTNRGRVSRQPTMRSSLTPSVLHLTIPPHVLLQSGGIVIITQDGPYDNTSPCACAPSCSDFCQIFPRNSSSGYAVWLLEQGRRSPVNHKDVPQIVWRQRPTAGVVCGYARFDPLSQDYAPVIARPTECRHVGERVCRRSECCSRFLRNEHAHYTKSSVWGEMKTCAQRPTSLKIPWGIFGSSCCARYRHTTIWF